MRARATALAAAVLALSSIVAATRSHDAEARVAALAATGDVQVANSRNGSAILSGGLGPGDSLTGTVTISNIGSAPGRFSLGLSHLTDSPGQGGGFLSRQLDLSVADVTAPSAPVVLFNGRLNSLNPTALGIFAAGEAHTYRFVVSWAAGPPDPTTNGSTMSVQFDWLAADAPVTAPPPPAPAPTPPAAPAAPPAIEPPRLGVTVTATQRVLTRGSVQAAAACDQACTVVATGSISAPGAARSYKLAPVRRTLTRAGNAKLELRLPRTARGPLRSALKAHRNVSASILISATGSTGKASRVRRKIRIVG
jgi:spore coat-associated protein N